MQSSKSTEKSSDKKSTLFVIKTYTELAIEENIFI